jgi:alkanesulfonate monooxygenase SsuD/methylene tetrahydromethanopterin reductase-like flavin-dependent oxidoreductase (luciferase family)
MRMARTPWSRLDSRRAPLPALAWRHDEEVVMEIGFHASHEQFPPSRLLGLVRRVETAGFDAVLSSDHVTPWSERQAESGFAWT